MSGYQQKENKTTKPTQSKWISTALNRTNQVMIRHKINQFTLDFTKF